MVGMEENERHKEEIIELTDETIELTDEVKAAPQKDDEIIDLVDEVADTDATGPADIAAPGTEPEMDIPDASEFNAASEETDTSETAPSTFPEGEIKIGDDIDDEMDFDEGGQDDFLNSMGMDLESDSPISQLPEENEPMPEAAPAQSAPATADAISSDQIEAAIERIIMKILPEKIDSILSAAVEKTLAREIDKIKGLLLEDSSGENV